MSSKDLRIILIIEPDSTNVELLEGMLEEEFDVKILLPEEASLETLEAISPSATILNPGNVEVDIQQVCDVLKRRNPKGYIIYLDEKESLERQVNAFDAGCNDYLHTPFNPIEIYHKVKTHISTASQTAQLMDQADSARSMAFTMMEANSELGAILRFIEDVMTTRDYGDLGEALASSGESFDISLAIQLRTHVGKMNFRCGNDSDIARLLTAAAFPGRIIENGRRLIMCTEHVAFFATKLPLDTEKYGRLKDNLAILLNAAEAKIKSLITELTLEDKRDHLIQNVMEKVSESNSTIQLHYEDHEKALHRTAEEFKDHMERVLMVLDLDEKQEEALTHSINEFLVRMMNTEETKNLIQFTLRSLLEDLEKI